eukprot:6706632-Pyramimonas_sp.AAC.1
MAPSGWHTVMSSMSEQIGSNIHAVPAASHSLVREKLATRGSISDGQRWNQRTLGGHREGHLAPALPQGAEQTMVD